MRLPILLAAISLGFSAVAQQPQAAEPKVELKLDPKQTATAGGTLKAKVLVTFAPGWHGYQNPPLHDYEIPLKIEPAVKDLKVKATYPKGEMKEFAGSKTLMYEGTVTIPVVLTMPKKTGPFTVKLDVSYQQCDDSSCLPPGKASVSQKLTLKKPAKPVKKP